jgi:hypothetical protein
LLPVRISNRVRQKLKPRVSYFLHEVGRGICQADFLDGGACLEGQRERGKSPRNALLREGKWVSGFGLRQDNYNLERKESLFCDRSEGVAPSPGSQTKFS